MEVKSENVKKMFDEISNQYDKMNDIITFGFHRIWKNKLISYALPANKVVDLCTGTGDLLPKLSKKFNTVLGVDFSEEMINLAKSKESNQISVLVGDVTNLQFEDNSFDCSTISYGLRNLENLEKGLNEIHRILKKDAQLLILESGQVNGFLSIFFRLYSDQILPFFGKIFAKNSSAYRYLPETAKQFPYGDSLVKILSSSGFEVTRYYPVLFGASYIYICQKV